MKLVTAVVAAGKVDDVKEALKAIGVTGMTVLEGQGFGRQPGPTERYRGAEFTVDFLPRAHLEVLADDAEVPRIVNAIVAAVRTGQVGDGKVWVTPVDSVVRIATGESGADAL